VRGCRQIGAFEDKELVGIMAYRDLSDYREIISLASKRPNCGVGRLLVDSLQGPLKVASDRNAEKFYERLGFISSGNKANMKLYERD